MSVELNSMRSQSAIWEYTEEIFTDITDDKGLHVLIGESVR
jgi:hypothetical protein